MSADIMDEVNALLMLGFIEAGIDDTPVHRLQALIAMSDAWAEREEDSIFTTIYKQAVDAEIAARIKDLKQPYDF